MVVTGKRFFFSLIKSEIMASVNHVESLEINDFFIFSYLPVQIKILRFCWTFIDIMTYNQVILNSKR